MRVLVFLADNTDFGHHNYDTKTEHLEGTEKGKHHTDFAPA